MIPPSNYYDIHVFEQEIRNLFKKNYYVANTQDVKTKNSYYSYILGDNPYTVRQHGGEYYNLENRCLHRLNLIDPIGVGERRFACDYHGWSYKNCGELESAPLALSDCVKRKIVGRQALLNCDGFLFNADHESDQLDLIRNLDFVNCGFYHSDSLVHKANWKLLVENVLENYHISFVHPESFVPTGITSSSRFRCIYVNDSSMFEILNDNEGKVNYKHAYIFPNLFISITGGLVGFMSYFHPTSATETVLKWRLFETDEMYKLNPAAREYIKKNSVKFTNTVLNEDKLVLETSQIGINGACQPYQLQSIEERLIHFHKSYMDCMAP